MRPRKWTLDARAGLDIEVPLLGPAAVDASVVLPPAAAAAVDTDDAVEVDTLDAQDLQYSKNTRHPDL